MDSPCHVEHLELKDVIKYRACTGTVRRLWNINVPNRRQPGSSLDPTASFSMTSRKSSIRSALISHSTRIEIGAVAEAVNDMRFLWYLYDV